MARPLEEKAAALLTALTTLVDAGQQPTMRELAHRSQVGLRDAKWSMANLVRARLAEIKGYRRVHYRNRPVAEYGRPSMVEEPGANTLGHVLGTWRSSALSHKE